MDGDRSSDLAAYLRTRRLRAGLTQQDLAERAGLTVETIGGVERGLRRRLYPHTARALAEALNLSPDERERLVALAHGPSRARGVQPPTRPVDSDGMDAVVESPRHNLPAAQTRLIGREQQLAEISARLGQTRLLTLTGAGGIGKTQLAIEAARAELDRFSDGVWFVDLAPLTDPALVAQAVSEVLSLRATPEQPFPQVLSAWLSARQVLLLLDNCEHLLDACARLVATLVQTCPRLTVIATSRERLGVAGEEVCHVPPLALPPAGWSVGAGVADAGVLAFAAVRLFHDRAWAIRADFSVTAANATAVVEICRTLDGLPLAIELAAARVGVLSPQQIATRLADRFALLARGRRDAPSRHQTLRALVDWSYEALTDAERTVLRRLAVFAGGWTLEAAEAVCSEPGSDEQRVLDLLAVLVEKSLVVLDLQGDEVRYRLLESIRAYAAEKLDEAGDTAATQQRHAAHFLAVAERWAPELRGPSQAEWMRRFDVEHNNLRAALRWALAHGDTDIAVRLCAAVWRFWYTKGAFVEGHAWLTAACVEPPRGSVSARAELLYALGGFTNLLGKRSEARSALEESAMLSEEAGNREGTANALDLLGLIELYNGDSARARMLFEQTLPIRRALGQPWGIAMTLDKLANLAFLEGDPAAAQPLYAESLEYMRRAGYQLGIATELIALGRVAHQLADDATAMRRLREALLLSRDLDAQEHIAFCLDGLAGILGARGDAVAAARLFGAGEALRRTVVSLRPGRLQADYERDRAAVEAALDAEAFAAACAAGAALPLAHAIAEAIALAEDGRAPVGPPSVS
jgi:non-specific serine/threonine protein kinase